MAKEVKSPDVYTDNEASTIETIEAFGWEFHSTREITSNYQEVQGGDLYNVRLSKIKLTFQCDKNMNNYTKLVDLEREFNAIPYCPSMPIIDIKP